MPKDWNKERIMSSKRVFLDRNRQDGDDLFPTLLPWIGRFKTDEELKNADVNWIKSEAAELKYLETALTFGICVVNSKSIYTSTVIYNFSFLYVILEVIQV